MRVNKHFKKINEELLKEGYLNKYPIGFFEKHNINPDELSYMGSGDLGKAYETEDGRVLKITKSRNEYEVSKMVQKKSDKLDHIAKVYDTVEFDGYFYILKELVEEEPAIEDYLMPELEMIYSEQGVGILEGLTYVDFEDYEQETGNEVSEEVKDFAQQLWGVVQEMQIVGVYQYDIDLKADNLGIGENGNIKLFDYVREK